MNFIIYPIYAYLVQFTVEKSYEIRHGYATQLLLKLWKSGQDLTQYVSHMLALVKHHKFPKRVIMMMKKHNIHEVCAC